LTSPAISPLGLEIIANYLGTPLWLDIIL